jgi:uncharacterized protein YndB with AHSA1/START domain
MVAVTSSGTAVVTLPTDTQILIEREFDAPRHLVYRAYTEPELIARWWSGKRGEVTNVEVDLRIGGTWRYVMTANEGFEVAFHGTFREIVPNERIVSTEVFEGAPGAGEYPSDDGGVLTTTMFTEVDGRTAMTQVVECGSSEVRDAIIESGMEGGMQEAMDALEEVAVSLR